MKSSLLMCARVHERKALFLALHRVLLAQLHVTQSIQLGERI